MQDQSNEFLMLSYRDGNTEAFSTLYERNKASLFRYFLRQIHRISIAEELAQDVWTKIIHARMQYTASAKFTTYLYQVAHNRLVDYFRRQSIRPVDPGFIEQDELDNDIVDKYTKQPDEKLDQYRLRNTLNRLIIDLPTEQREAFLLKEEAGLAIADIAEVTQVTHETAKSRIRYAFKKLREGLGALQ